MLYTHIIEMDSDTIAITTEQLQELADFVKYIENLNTK